MDLYYVGVETNQVSKYVLAYFIFYQQVSECKIMTLTFDYHFGGEIQKKNAKNAEVDKNDYRKFCLTKLFFHEQIKYSLCS